MDLSEKKHDKTKLFHAIVGGMLVGVAGSVLSFRLYKNTVDNNANKTIFIKDKLRQMHNSVQVNQSKLTDIQADLTCIKSDLETFNHLYRDTDNTRAMSGYQLYDSSYSDDSNTTVINDYTF